MDPSFEPQLAAAAAVGLAVGLWLLVRGMQGYRTATLIADTGTSTIASVAAGEVRISGTVEADAVTLVSPLQSVPCVYYRSSIDGDDDLPGSSSERSEERAVGFRVRDATGAIRVFPRGARWDAPVRFDAKAGSMDDPPAGLAPRTGGLFALAEPDRDAAIAALLTVRPEEPSVGFPSLAGAASRGTRHYREARLEVGDAVTIVGRALPFGDLADPTEADLASGSDLPSDDPEVAANIAEARAAGLLLDDPAEAWGNAAIPGFGVGRPTRTPSLDPAADRLPIASVAEAARAARTFDIDPGSLVLASAPDVPLLIVHGAPSSAVRRQQDRFLLGLLGAVLAIASSLVLAIAIGDVAR